MESQLRCIRTLSDKANSLMFSSDGKTLVSISYNNKTANIWDVNTGELKQNFTGLKNIALSLDGKTLAGSRDDNTIQLWDLETGELKHSLGSHLSQIIFINFSPNGTTLVSRDKETINVWDVSTGELKSSLKSGVDSGYWQTETEKTVFSPNGQTLAIASYTRREDSTVDKAIILWDVETCQVIKTIDDNFGSLAFSHDGKTLFISGIRKETSYVSYPDGGRDDYESTYKYTRLLDLTTGKIRNTFHSNHFCALSPDGQIFIGVQAEYYQSTRYRSVNMIDVGTGKTIKSFSGTAAALSPDGKILAVDEDGQSLKLVDGSSGVSIAALSGYIKNFAFSPDSTMLAVAHSDTIQLWQNSTEPIVQQRLHGDAYPHLNRLEDLLAAERWDDADQETAGVITRFPAQDLNVVDQLWMHYSNGNYGFSRQKEIWEAILRNEVRRMDLNCRPLDDIDQFEYSVGWGRVDYHQHYHGANDEYFTKAWNKTNKGYYPRAVHQNQPLEIFSRLGG